MKCYDDIENSEVFYQVCGLVDNLRDMARDEIHDGYKQQLEHLYQENSDLKERLAAAEQYNTHLLRYKRAYEAVEGSEREVLALS